jgi:hypothetical protein
MWLGPTLTKCKKCKKEFDLHEFPFREDKGEYLLNCYNCTNTAKGTREVSKRRIIYVKTPWRDAIIKLSNRSVYCGKVVFSDLGQLIDEGYFFILKKNAIDLYEKTKNQ